MQRRCTAAQKTHAYKSHKAIAKYCAPYGVGDHIYGTVADKRPRSCQALRAIMLLQGVLICLQLVHAIMPLSSLPSQILNEASTCCTAYRNGSLPYLPKIFSEV